MSNIGNDRNDQTTDNDETSSVQLKSTQKTFENEDYCLKTINKTIKDKLSELSQRLQRWRNIKFDMTPKLIESNSLSGLSSLRSTSISAGELGSIKS